MKAEKPEARRLTDAERGRIREREESTFRELRLFLRDVINKLGRDRKFAMFAKPVDVTEVMTHVGKFLLQQPSSNKVFHISTGFTGFLHLRENWKKSGNLCGQERSGENIFFGESEGKMKYECHQRC